MTKADLISWEVFTITVSVFQQPFYFARIIQTSFDNIRYSRIKCVIISIVVIIINWFFFAMANLFFWLAFTLLINVMLPRYKFAPKDSQSTLSSLSVLIIYTRNSPISCNGTHASLFPKGNSHQSRYVSCNWMVTPLGFLRSPVSIFRHILYYDGLTATSSYPMWNYGSQAAPSIYVLKKPMLKRVQCRNHRWRSLS